MIMIARAMRLIDQPASRMSAPLSGSPPQGGRGWASHFIDAACSSFSSPLVGEAGRGATGAAHCHGKRADETLQQKATS